METLFQPPKTDTRIMRAKYPETQGAERSREPCVMGSSSRTSANVAPETTKFRRITTTTVSRLMWCGYVMACHGERHRELNAIKRMEAAE